MLLIALSTQVCRYVSPSSVLLAMFFWLLLFFFGFFTPVCREVLSPSSFTPAFSVPLTVIRILSAMEFPLPLEFRCRLFRAVNSSGWYSCLS